MIPNLSDALNWNMSRVYKFSHMSNQRLDFTMLRGLNTDRTKKEYNQACFPTEMADFIRAEGMEKRRRSLIFKECVSN